MAIFQSQGVNLTLTFLALVFGRKLDLFKNGNFSAKSQVFGLDLFKNGNFSLTFLAKNLTSSKMAIFQQNPKGLTLLFGQKLDLFKNAIFQQSPKGLTLTLLFGQKLGLPLQKWQFKNPKNFWQNWTSSKIPKSQGLTLLFGQKLDLFKNGNFSANSQGFTFLFGQKLDLLTIFQQNLTFFWPKIGPLQK